MIYFLNDSCNSLGELKCTQSLSYLEQSDMAFNKN